MSSAWRRVSMAHFLTRGITSPQAALTVALGAFMMVPVKPNRAANGGVFQPECGGWEPPRDLIAGGSRRKTRLVWHRSDALR
jgi:hypothetical protein